MRTLHTFKITDEEKSTILTVLRAQMPDTPSWSVVRKLLRSRVVAIGGVLCLDEGRRLGKGEVITVSDHSFPPPPGDEQVVISHVDNEVIVVQKPSGMVTLRRKTDSNWTWARKNLQPTLDECVPRVIGRHAAKKEKSETNYLKLPELFPVHRIDRDSSGLLVFARNKESQTKVIHQFAQHDAVRKYLALVPGTLKDKSITSQFIRDRGDGLRGSTTDTSIGEHATTHFRTLRRIAGFSEIECTLETGRTNQIRIHLAELGHPICGDIKYRGPFGKNPVKDKSQIHRMALHAAELRFVHPTTGKPLHFVASWPKDVMRFLDRLQKRLAKKRS